MKKIYLKLHKWLSNKLGFYNINSFREKVEELAKEKNETYYTISMDYCSTHILNYGGLKFKCYINGYGSTNWHSSPEKSYEEMYRKIHPMNEGEIKEISVNY